MAMQKSPPYAPAPGNPAKPNPPQKYSNAKVVVLYDDTYYSAPQRLTVPNPGQGGPPPTNGKGNTIYWLLNFNVPKKTNKDTPPAGTLQFQLTGVDTLSFNVYLYKDDGTFIELGTNNNTNTWDLPAGDPSVGIT